MTPVLLSRLAVAVATCVATAALAADGSAPGVTATEIKIGQTMPYSGPASSFSAIGKAMFAYFEKINKDGGINGRKINLISLDDAYSPPKAVEQTRRLVESEDVFAIVGSFGSQTNFATQKYLNAKKVPALFIGSGANRFAEPQASPWSMGWQPNNVAKGRIYGKYVLATKPDAKVAVLFENNDFGRDHVKGFREALGGKAATMIVKEMSYEASEPTVDSQVQLLRSTGADVFLDISTPKFSAQAIRRVAESKWNTMHFLSDASGSVVSVLTPAGLDNSKGVLTLAFRKDPSDPKWADDPGVKDYLAFMKAYMPDANPLETYNVFGVATAQTFLHVLEKCGSDVTRENIMKQAADIHGLVLPMMLPGITLDTSPTQFTPLHQEQIMQFDGTRWVAIGDVIDAEK